jgi:hypothetical protein
MIDAVLIGQMIEVKARCMQSPQQLEDVYYRCFSIGHPSTLSIQFARALQITSIITAWLRRQLAIYISDRRLAFRFRSSRCYISRIESEATRRVN